MSWFSEGFAEAEKMASAANSGRRRSRNFYTRSKDEEAIVRFLKPAKESFNYKRAFVPWAKGQKQFTSPGSQPDPLVEAGLQLQAAFAWPILDRRKFEFEVEEDGKKIQKTVSLRYLFFADGQMTRKALIALENTMRKELNEEREESGKAPLTEDEYNLTHFDVRIQKAEKGWRLTAVRGGKPKPLSKEDNEIIEKYAFDLREELKPLPVAELRGLVAKESGQEEASEAATEYSYGDDKAAVGATAEPTFFGEDD